MVSRLGRDTPEDEQIVQRVLAITDTYKALTDDLRWPGPDGCELTRLDDLVESNITVTHTLISSQKAARASMLHLAWLLEGGLEPRVAVTASLSRAALVSAVRIVYVLGPVDPATREDHARRVLRGQAVSHLRGVTAFSSFEDLVALIPPETLKDDLTASRDALDGGGVTDTQMIADTAAVIARTIADSAPDHLGEVAAKGEHLAWMWNVWSGIAHGYAWPTLVPGVQDDGQQVMPGHWVTDFGTLSSIVLLALHLLRDGLKLPV